jgi:NRAMP (natural resistance-associated macrophage protein)-like metal ion transporter
LGNPNVNENAEPEKKPGDVFEATDAPSLAQGAAKDQTDVQSARKNNGDGSSQERNPLLKIGPGLITGAADDDPSGIGTYSVAGAQFGYQLLWLAPLCLPLMIAVQEMCGRVGLVTGKGLTAIIKEHYPKWLMYGVLALLVGANTINVYADINAMAASAKMLFGLPFMFWATALTIGMVAAQIAIPYKQYVKLLRYTCLALFSYAVIAVMPKVHVDWPSVAHHMLIPQWSSKPQYVLTVVGFLGTTISPYLFFWQAAEQVEEDLAEGLTDDAGHRDTQVKHSEIRAVRADTATGMIFSQIITVFIIVSTAATLHASGKTDINTAEDAARALSPLGPSAY